ncbi:hypothetical protein BDY21DRAFT_395091 [Lineolata rhizophorae]|uniref:Uncharacterized protein n=1 Tax=Lineolata rhizophorae TaxID=578093 RepID=A0A6A6NWF8_9PEZI|nr:hypothetical protein BDY21DRAFT_395091 [Lineolata rhizophorae]
MPPRGSRSATTATPSSPKSADAKADANVLARRGSPTVINQQLVPDAPPAMQPSRLSPALKFTALLSLRLAISWAMHTGAEKYGWEEKEALAGVSRHIEDVWTVGAFLAWRVFEVGIIWACGFDYADTAALTTLSHTPHYLLLTAFYNLPPRTALLCIFTDVLALSLPSYLLLPTSTTRTLNSPNRPLATDPFVAFTTSTFAAAVYAVILFASLKTWLGVFLTTRFEGLRSLEAAHAAGLGGCLVVALPLGWCAREFVFTPAVAALPPAPKQAEGAPPPPPPPLEPFDPAAATLGETFVYNLGLRGASPRAKTLLARGALLVGWTSANVFEQVWGSVKGVEPGGAAGWAGLWGAAAAVVVAGLGWIGKV